MVGVTVVVEELAVVVVGIPVVVDSGVVVVVVVVRSLQSNATERKITCFLSFSKRAA